MSKYERFNHAKTFLRYHLIFSTKYRRKCLNPIRDDLLAAMRDAQERNGNFRIEIDEVDQDHIHLLVRIKPCECIANVVHDLKQQSTYLMWQQHHDYLTKFYSKAVKFYLIVYTSMKHKFTIRAPLNKIASMIHLLTREKRTVYKFLFVLLLTFPITSR